MAKYLKGEEKCRKVEERRSCYDLGTLEEAILLAFIGSGLWGTGVHIIY